MAPIRDVAGPCESIDRHRAGGAEPVLVRKPGLTAQVNEAVEVLDYTINELARALQTCQTKTVGMLVPDIITPFHATLVRGAEERLKRSVYSLLLGVSFDTPEEESRYRVDGIGVDGLSPVTTAFTRRLRRSLRSSIVRAPIKSTGPPRK